MTAYYATTRFYQNDQEFECTWDLNVTKGAPTDEETIQHLAAILSENFAGTWSTDEDHLIDLHGCSAEEFAHELVLKPSESETCYGVTWEICTHWEEVDPDRKEHPCNL